MKNIYLYALVGGAFVLLTSKPKKSYSKQIKKDEPKEQEDILNKGYKYIKNCQEVQEDNILTTINYAKEIGEKYDPKDWPTYLFEGCISGDRYFSNTVVATYSFDLYKYAATGAVNAGKMTKEVAKQLLLNFKEMAYAAGIKESETWYVELQA